MTSDERREVAENLREIDKVWPTLADDLKEDPLHFSGLAIAGIIACVDSSSVFRRIADLIDPTCEFVQINEFNFRCSICGSEVSLDYHLLPGHDLPFNYCPRCGARMVRGDE